MAYYLFDTWRGGVLLALVLEVAALLWWAFTRSPRSSWALLIGPAVVGLTVLLDWAVETNREQAQRLTRQVVQAAEDENAEQIIGLLNPRMTPSAGLDYSQVCMRIATLFSRPLIESNHIIELMVESAEDSHSRVVFRVATLIDPDCPYRVYTPLVKTKWQFDFTRSGDEDYRLDRFTMLEMNGGEPVDILKYHPLQ